MTADAAVLGRSRSLPRERPGGAEDVHRALHAAAMAEAARIAGPGWGPGAETRMSAWARPAAPGDIAAARFPGAPQ